MSTYRVCKIHILQSNDYGLIQLVERISLWWIQTFIQLSASEFLFQDLQGILSLVFDSSSIFTDFSQRLPLAIRWIWSLLHKALWLWHFQLPIPLWVHQLQDFYQYFSEFIIFELNLFLIVISFYRLALVQCVFDFERVHQDHHHFLFLCCRISRLWLLVNRQFFSLYHLDLSKPLTVLVTSRWCICSLMELLYLSFFPAFLHFNHPFSQYLRILTHSFLLFFFLIYLDRFPLHSSIQTFSG